MKVRHLLVLPMAILAAGTAYANEPAANPGPAAKIATPVEILTIAQQDSLKAAVERVSAHIAARKIMAKEEAAKIERLNNSSQPIDGMTINTIKDAMPAHLRLTPAEAEAQGWPCERTSDDTARLSSMIFAAAKQHHHRVLPQAVHATSAKVMKAMTEAADDCTDCADCADGVCTEAAHKQARGAHCKDCPDAATA